MKIRNGFVSNSSSSSFIIGIANVTGKDISHNNIFTFDIDNIDYESWVVQLYGVDGEYDFNIIVNNNFLVKIINAEKMEYELSIVSFNDSKVSCIVKNQDKVLFQEGSCLYDEDSYFWNEKLCCMDYDSISLNDFHQNDIDLYNLILENGGEVTFGAGRNG